MLIHAYDQKLVRVTWTAKPQLLVHTAWVDKPIRYLGKRACFEHKEVGFLEIDRAPPNASHFAYYPRPSARARNTTDSWATTIKVSEASSYV